MAIFPVLQKLTHMYDYGYDYDLIVKQMQIMNMIVNRVMPIMHICYWLPSVCSALGLPITSAHQHTSAITSAHCTFCTLCALQALQYS